MEVSDELHFKMVLLLSILFTPCYLLYRRLDGRPELVWNLWRNLTTIWLCKNSHTKHFVSCQYADVLLLFHAVT
jgi:hypothetical protein